MPVEKERLSGTRYELLDVFRGVACLMVILHHTGFAVAFDGVHETGLDGWLKSQLVALCWEMALGVPLFFVISGYCIAASADGVRTRGFGGWRFLGRRLWRIYPPYWVSLLLFAGVMAGLDRAGRNDLHFGAGRYALQLSSPGSLDAVQWAGNVTLTEEWRPLVWRPPTKLVYTRVAWSLCYEEQFYFVCFLALLVARRRLFGALAAITVVVFLIRLTLFDIGLSERLDGAFPLLWHEFAVGLAVYWRFHGGASLTGKRVVDLTLVSLAFASWFNRLYLPLSPVSDSTIAASLFGLLLIALKRFDPIASQLRVLAPLRACGRRCYSIYLIHLPVCTIGNLILITRFGLTSFWMRVLVVMPVVTAAALGCSWLFFYLVERHFLNPPILPQGRAVLLATASEPLAGEAPA